MPPEHVASSSWSWIVVAIGLVALLGAVGAWFLLGGSNGERRVVLVHRAGGAGKHGPAAIPTDGSAADGLAKALEGLPVRTSTEPVGPLWHGERDVLSQRPALLVVEESAFVMQPGDEAAEQGSNRLLLFLGYAALATPETRFLVHSSGFESEQRRRLFVATAIERFPELEGRLFLFAAPSSEGTPAFEDPATVRALRQLVAEILDVR